MTADLTIDQISLNTTSASSQLMSYPILKRIYVGGSRGCRLGRWNGGAGAARATLPVWETLGRQEAPLRPGRQGRFAPSSP